MRNYSYGAKAPIENGALVREELIMAHRYYNDLIVIQRERKAARDALYKVLKAQLPKDAKVIFTDEQKAQMKAFDEIAWEKTRVARGTRGCSWGTGGRIEKAVQKAYDAVAKVPEALPHFRRWNGGGTVAVQLQGGLPVAELLAGTDTQLRVHGTGKRRTLWIRIGSDGKSPVWAKFPFICHRDIPPTAVVKEACVIVRCVGIRPKYDVQFILDGVDGALRPAPTKGMVAVDIGWRWFHGDGMRVATWKDDAGESGELRLSEELLRRWRKTEDLVSIRAKNFNAAVKTLCAARDSASGWPEWLKERSATAGLWKASSRLTHLMLHWQGHRFAGDEALFVELDAWRAKEDHLHEWECFQRLNVLRSRREVYRLFGCFLAKYREVVFEKMDLRGFAEHPEEDEPKESYEVIGARPRRFQACLSELRTCAKDAVQRAGGEWVDVPPEYTTQTCSSCGVVKEFDAAKEVTHTCEACGATWDQDVNACDNLLRAVKSEEMLEACSKKKLPAVPEETVAEKRRRVGLATRRARRSNVEA